MKTIVLAMAEEFNAINKDKMKILKKIIKYFLISLVGLILIFYILTNHSEKVSSYKCVGTILMDNNEYPKNFYIRHTDYRWWIFWGDSAGFINLEVPNEWVDVYHDLKIIGDQIQIFKKDFSSNELKIVGNFSRLSEILRLQTHVGFYDGECKKIEN